MTDSRLRALLDASPDILATAVHAAYLALRRLSIDPHASADDRAWAHSLADAIGPGIDQIRRDPTPVVSLADIPGDFSEVH
jgi:hypothetical protein